MEKILENSWKQRLHVHEFQECILFMYVRATETPLDHAEFYFKILFIIRIYNNLNLIYKFEYILNYKRNPSVTSRGNYGKNMKKWKYIDTIFLNYQLYINSLNNVIVYLDPFVLYASV